MRLIDADYVVSALNIFNDREHGSEHFIYGIETAKEIVENAPTITPEKPKHESRAMLPCKCGGTRREHWYGVNRESLVCKRCGFTVLGKNAMDVIREWNKAVSQDG